MRRYKGDKKKVNDLFSEVIRSLGYCEAEGYRDSRGKIPRTCMGPLQPAHIVTRERNSTFADTRNAFSLCASHHFLFHNYAREFSRFISTTWAQEYYDEVYRKSWDTIQGKKAMHLWEERLMFLNRIKNGELTIAEARKAEDAD